MIETAHDLSGDCRGFGCALSLTFRPIVLFLTLAHRLFAAFLAGVKLAMPGADKYREHVAGFMQPVRALVKPVSERLFAGALDISKVPSFGDRLKFRPSVILGVWSEGDHRDWNAIRAWAESLPPLLLR